jgi:hypothetical protein
MRLSIGAVEKEESMSVTITVSDEVAQHLEGLSFGQAGDINEKLRLLLAAEYRRRLTRYSLTDRQFTQKYQMSFETFEHQQLTQQHGYAWEVESDAIDWETAVDGIRTLQRQLAALTQAGNTDDH